MPSSNRRSLYVRYLLALACAATALVAPRVASISGLAADEVAPTAAQDQPEMPRFIRVTRNEKKQPQHLEAAVVRYQPTSAENRVTVDLVAAVHIGETSYYEELNRRFGDYDAVLYELVAPENARPQQGHERAGHPIEFLQRGMKGILGLEFQLDRIDYSAANFVHADMTPEEFSETMRRRGESVSQMFFRVLQQSIVSPPKNSESLGEVQLLAALIAKDRDLRLRRILAQQFENMDEMTATMFGPDGSTLITERNKKALQVLRREIDAGKKRLAIFYGAGHLSDLESRLDSDFQMKRVREEWIPAWSLAKLPDQKPAEKKTTQDK